MDEPLDKLEIQIETTSADAAKRINTLADAVEKLKSASTGNFGGLRGALEAINKLNSGTISEISNSLKALKDASSFKIGKGLTDSISELAGAMKAVKAEDVSRLGQIGRSLKSFEGLGQVKLNPGFANNLVLLTAAINEIKEDSYERLNGIAEAMSKFSSVGQIRLSKDLGDNLRNITDAVKDISEDSIAKIDRLAESFEKLSNFDAKSIRAAFRSAKNGVIEATDSGTTTSTPETNTGKIETLEAESRIRLLIDRMLEYKDSVMGSDSAWKALSKIGNESLNRISIGFSKLKTASSKAFMSIASTGNSAWKSLSRIGAEFADKISAGLSSVKREADKAFGEIADAGKKIGSSYLSSFSAIGGKIVQRLGLDKAFKSIESIGKKLGAVYTKAFSAIGNVISKNFSLDKLVGEAKWVGATIAQPIVVGFSLAVSSIQRTISAISTAKEKTENYVKSFSSAMSGLARAFHGPASAVGNFAKRLLSIRFQNVANQVKNFTERINNLTSSLGRIFLYRAVRTVIKEISQAIQEGVNNLSAWSRLMGTEFHKSLDGIATDALYIKNSFATIAEPLINAVKPAIDAIADAIANALNLLAQFVALLSGASTYTKAIRKTTEYGDAIQKAGAKAKEAKKQLLGIDELNIFSNQQSGGGGGGFDAEDYSNMFEQATVGIENQFVDIFDVFKKAWESEGQATIDAIKSAWESVKALIEAVGKSFREVFTNGTGQETLETYLRIIQNIAGIIGGFADAFRRAWEENNRGTEIVQKLWDIHNKILKTWERITGATKEWIASIDFAPLLDSVNRLLDAIEPLVSIILDGLAWAWENVMLPIGKWVIEDALPASIDVVTAAIEVLTSVIEKLKPVGEWLWENLLKPIGQWTGELLIEALNGVTDALNLLKAAIDGDSDAIAEAKRKFTEWFDGLTIGQTFLLTFITTLATLVAGIFAFNAIVAAASAVVGVFSGVLAFLAANPIVVVIGAIALLVAAIVTLITHWDEVKEKASAVWDSISETASKIVSGIKQKWEDLKKWWSNLTLPEFKIKLPHFKLTGEFSLNPPSTPKIGIDWYAQGGFPDNGDLFIANERGPEWVGSLNGRTTVANNGQVEDGIEEAAYRGFMRALMESGGGGTSGNDRAVNIYLDGRQIATSTMRYQRQFARATGG